MFNQYKTINEIVKIVFHINSLKLSVYFTIIAFIQQTSQNLNVEATR